MLFQKYHFPREVVLNFFANTRRPRNGFQVVVFAEFFEKPFSFVILNKLAKFDQQTVFTFPSCSVRCISCFMLNI